MKKNINKNDWRVWDKKLSYGQVLYKRAIGELEEMQSAKSLCGQLKLFYKPGLKVLDVGCGAGHYLRSLRARLDKNINYTGVDATKGYIKLAKKAFGEKANFFVGDIYNLPFNSRAFDMVMCNNVILHLPPPPAKAIAELIRVAKGRVIIRTVMSARNYIIKEIGAPNEEAKRPVSKEVDLIDDNGNPYFYNYFNMYSEDYLKYLVSKIDKNLKVSFIADDKWTAFDNRKVSGALATRAIDGRQVSGNLILDWKFIIIKKK